METGLRVRRRGERLDWTWARTWTTTWAGGVRSCKDGWAGGGYVYRVNPSMSTDLPRVSDEEWAGCLGVVRSMRAAIFVVAYNAEAHIRETLRPNPRRAGPPSGGHLRHRRQERRPYRGRVCHI